MATFTEKDLQQIQAHGLSRETVEGQIEKFRTGFDFLKVDSAAVVGDGVVRLTPAEVEQYCADYDRLGKDIRVVKFVPASGAATRMFKELFELLTDGKGSKCVDELMEGLGDFAFHEDIEQIATDTDPQKVVAAILKQEGLNYGAQPKALIKFHKYDDGGRTAAEEHLSEGAMYAAPAGRVNIHFTVSGEHLAGFKSLFERVLDKYEKKYGVKYDISFSQQKSSTDTIAVAMDNEPFREASGSLLFRPAGHGALLSNLNDIDADLVFVKNIDNIAPDRLKGDTVVYKKALAGMLLRLQQDAFALGLELEQGRDEALLSRAAAFVQDKLCYKFPEGFKEWNNDERYTYIKSVLDRPMRVCGVVRNEGEPGGGPFWVRNNDGSRSLQIAESSQIAPADMHLMQSATHFNPVDLVCAVKNAAGVKYDLMRYTDPETGFISTKSKDGRQLKAQEVPGLWNGAMARWNTVFVETPISTFSPVKVVTDLLRPQHR